MNHYPLIARKMYGECRDIDPDGRVDPFGPISCPKCRERIAEQVAAKRDGAMSFKADEPERQFFLANAASLEKVLAQ